MAIIKKKWGRQKPLLGTQHDRSHPLSYGLVGHWIMNESGGKTAYDISGKGNHGTLTDSSPALLGPVWTQGQFGPALSFDGSDDYVTIADNVSLNITGAISMSAWIKSTDVGGLMHVIGAYATTTPFGGYGFNVGYPTLGHFAYWGGNGAGSWKESNSTVHDGNWHHIVVTVSGTTVAFYRDGIADGTVVGQQPTTYSGVRVVGARVDVADPFNGLIDDVRVYNLALSADEVMSLYREPFADMVQPRIWLPETVIADTPITPPQGAGVLSGAAGRMDLGIFVPTAV